MDINIHAIVNKLQNSGYGWISKADTEIIINLVLEEIQPDLLKHSKEPKEFMD